MDYNDHRPDGDMGTVTFELGQLAQDAIKEGNETPILKDGKERGVLRYDLYVALL
jgi:Ca2+-dependent lipid-binding protein